MDIVENDVLREVLPASRRPDLEPTLDIERVVALEGDTVALRDGRLVVNGLPVVIEHTGQEYRDLNGRSSEIVLERIAGHNYRTLDSPAEDLGFSALEVPANHVFLLGDNRDYSRDSRVYGPFPMGDIVGSLGRLYDSVDAHTERGRPERVGMEIR